MRVKQIMRVLMGAVFPAFVVPHAWSDEEGERSEEKEREWTFEKVTVGALPAGWNIEVS